MPETYVHPKWAFEETGTTFSFLVFGSAAITWFILRFLDTGSPSGETKYTAVSTDEEVAVLKVNNKLLSGQHNVQRRVLKEGSTEMKKAVVDVVESKRGESPHEQHRKMAKEQKKKKKKKIEPITTTRKSILLFFNNISQFGAIMFYSWICENKPIFEHATKHYSRDVFWFITLIYLGLALSTIKPNPKDTSLLNREQTEEWKGWMQFLFLMYHYFHASETYNAIRIFISCYVWMTGFGNFSFFYIKRDFGAVRFWQMMWRLNFLVFWLMMVHGNTFILYYINPLHTFYFLMVFATMWLCSSCNHDKYPIRWKVIGLALLIFLIWDVPGMFRLFWGWLPQSPIIGATKGVLHEWHFRSGLDHYSALFGMAFALNYPLAQAWLDTCESKPTISQWCMKGAILAVVLLGIGLWVSNIFVLPKFEYNEHHPYFFWIPLIGYIFLRNCSITLRSYHLELLTQMGKITLETYLMQHHIWLTSNAKTLLVFIPGAPLVNFLAVSAVYLLLSHRLFRLTVGLRAMLIPADWGAASKLFIAMCTFLGSVYGAAKVLNIMGGEIAIVILATVALGLVVYSTVKRIIVTGSIEYVRGPYFIITGLVSGAVFVGLLIETFVFMDKTDQVDAQGGVAQSIPLGMMCFLVFSLIVISMDNYIGLSHVANWLICEPLASWESAYSPLHDKIFSRGAK